MNMEKRIGRLAHTSDRIDSIFKNEAKPEFMKLSSGLQEFTARGPKEDPLQVWCWRSACTGMRALWRRSAPLCTTRNGH